MHSKEDICDYLPEKIKQNIEHQEIMSLQLRQSLKLTQQLVMTPQLQQAIKLLQLSRIELVNTVQQALLENPLLEESQNNVEGSYEDVQETREEKDNEISSEEANLLHHAEWDDYIGNFSSTSRHATEREVPEEMASYESVYAAKHSLESHLYWQLYLSDFQKQEKEIGEAIIDSLDSGGYLSNSVEEIAEHCGYPMEQVESVLKRIQLFDPIGVASRNLQECLITQLKISQKDEPILYSLIQDHLEDLEQRKFQSLARKFNVSVNRVEQYFKEIQALDPKPGSGFGGNETYYITPDAYVYKYGNEFIIVLNDEDLPNLQLNSYYLEALNKKDFQNKDYLQDKMREAMWLIKSVQQRQRTLYRVLESIIKFQEDFFENGVAYLKPLILKEVAEDIEVHESTVSRITTNKYVSTPFGIFELKYFFNSGLGVRGGGQVASQSVKATIKKLIEQEDPQEPLSDKKIVSLLNQQLQVDIARRTVAKYREAMDIASSSKRKRYTKRDK